MTPWHVLTWHSDILGPIPNEGCPISPGEHYTQMARLAWTERGRFFRNEEAKKGYVGNLENPEQLRECEKGVCNTTQITWMLVSSL